MTATLMFEGKNRQNCAFPLDQLQSTYGKSYYKFYQLKLRQLLIDNQYRQEHDGKHSKQKQRKSHLNDKRIPKDYMNHLREKIKIQSQDDELRKRSSSVIAVTNRRTKDCVTYTITSTDIPIVNTIVPTEFKTKSILKNKQSSVSTKHQRVTSAPANSQRNRHKKTPMKIPTIEIDDTDDKLSKSNAYSYTQVSSSSSAPENHLDKNYYYARQSILNTIMSHLHLYTPSDISKWNLYRDYNEKISTSISPIVYRNFERIIL